MRQDREEREEIKTCGMGGGMGKEDKNIIWQRKEGGGRGEEGRGKEKREVCMTGKEENRTVYGMGRMKG